MDIDKFFTTTADHYCNVTASGEEIYTFDKKQLFDFLEKFKQEICKEQRVICEEIYSLNNVGDYRAMGNGKLILTAPEPKLERGEK